jgi:hypothetical protein
MRKSKDGYLINPDPLDPRLTECVMRAHLRLPVTAFCSPPTTPTMRCVSLIAPIRCAAASEPPKGESQHPV